MRVILKFTNLKQQIITGLKKKLLMLELPEGATDVSHSRALGNSMIVYKTKGQDAIKPVPTAEWMLVGKLTDIAESQCEEFVEWVDVPQYYKDYRKDGWQGDITAQESFFSALEANRVYFENKLGEYPTKQNTGLEYGMEYISKVASWEEVQEVVWDKDRTWCFEIIS